MSIPSFSLRVLFVVVAYLAIVFASIWIGSLAWASVVYNVTIGILLVASLAAVFYANSGTNFLRGFCLIAWIYIFLAPSRYEQNTPIEHPLVTHQILSIAYERLLAPMYLERGLIFPGWDPSQALPWQAFVQTGHCLWTFILGVAGGCLAVFFRNRSENRRRAR
jgi:hypothetical protein